MRNPYVTGSWVSGREHYGRQSLLTHILESPEDAVWVVGNRRIGKTSLLRQLELLAAGGSTYVPLYWDLQGSTSLQELSAELVYSVEEHVDRFRPLGVNAADLRNQDAIGILRLLRRRAWQAGKSLLLLCDEAEALLQVAQLAPSSIARLRKVLQSDRGLRVVLASTKTLSRIDDLDLGTSTSPFLFGFGLRNLTGLDAAATAALIRQEQNAEPVVVSDELVVQISEITNNHPYLTQVLCSRLFEPEGRLRAINLADLALDTSLTGYFANDFRNLSPGERQIMISAALGHATIEGLAADTGLDTIVAQDFAYGLERLGQLRVTPGGFQPGNEFLRQWLQPIALQSLKATRTSPANGGERSPRPYICPPELGPETDITDETTLALIQQGQAQEAEFVLSQLPVERARLKSLERRSNQSGEQMPSDLVDEINQVRILIDNLESRLALIPPAVQNGVKHGAAAETPVED